MNIFEQAARKKLRFASPRGDLTVEQLWELPLKARAANSVDLDTVAKLASAEVRAQDEESFVSVSSNPQKALAELRLEIAKYIIADKMAEAESAKTVAARKAERERLQSILADKQEEALKSLSAEEIAKRIAELG